MSQDILNNQSHLQENILALRHEHGYPVQQLANISWGLIYVGLRMPITYSCNSPILANTAKMAVEPLRRRKPTQTHPHHHSYYENCKDLRSTKHQSIASRSISITISVPLSIARYCTSIAARSGLKAVFSSSAKPADREEPMNERPIHSIWYGRANTAPDETPSPSKVDDNRPTHDTGIGQWKEKAAVVNITPLVLCDSQCKDLDSRRRSLKEMPVTMVQRDEDSDLREPADEEEA